MMRGGTGGETGGKVIRTRGQPAGQEDQWSCAPIEKAFDGVYKPIRARASAPAPRERARRTAAPIEDATRVRYGGISYPTSQSGISASEAPRRRAEEHLALASLIGAFGNRKSLADALADEIILASNKDSNSYVIKKKVELKRIARSAR